MYDLDGTILDSKFVHYRGWQDAGDRFNVPITPEFLGYQYGKTNEAAAQWLLGPQRYAEFGTSFVEAKKTSVVAHAGEAALFKDFEPAFCALVARKIPVWICTSSPKDYCSAIFVAIPELKALADKTVWRESYPNGKPNPDALLVTFQKMGLEVNDCIYVGDAHVDYLAARNAGCGFFYYLPRKQDRDPGFGDIKAPCISDHRQILAAVSP